LYNIELSKQSDKFLNNLKDKKLQERILKSIFNLKINPKPKGNFKYLKPDKENLRIRIGTYRVVYTIKEDKLIILIIKIDKRSKVYN
jgi:mRNA interferase RelE/StbE